MILIGILGIHSAFADTGNQTNTSIRVGNENYYQVQQSMKNFMIQHNMQVQEEKNIASFTLQQQLTHQKLSKLLDIFSIPAYEQYLKDRPIISKNMKSSELQQITEYTYVNVVLSKRELAHETQNLQQQRINIEDAAKIQQTNVSHTS
jgi:hypothetical protein